MIDEEEIRAALEQLDGTTLSAVALITGLSPQDIEELGGIPDE